MRTILSALSILFLIALSPGIVRAQTKPPADVIALHPEQLEWQQTEEGYAMTVLYGDPSGEGHYAIRFMLPPKWEGRPHTHGGAEIVTVHSGTLQLAYGEDLSREAAKAFGPGSFIVLPAGTRMRGFTGDEDVIVDVQGQGPFTIQYLDEEGD